MKKYNYSFNLSAVILIILFLLTGCAKDDIPTIAQISTFDQSLAGNWLPTEHKLYYYVDINRPGADTTRIFVKDSISTANNLYFSQNYYRLILPVAKVVNNVVALDTLKMKSDFTFSFGLSAPTSAANTKWYVVKNDDSRDSGLGQLKFGIVNPATGFWSYEKMYNIKEVSSTKLVIQLVNNATEKVFYKIDAFGRVLMIDRLVVHTITYKKI